MYKDSSSLSGLSPDQEHLHWMKISFDPRIIHALTCIFTSLADLRNHNHLQYKTSKKYIYFDTLYISMARLLGVPQMRKPLIILAILFSSSVASNNFSERKITAGKLWFLVAWIFTRCFLRTMWHLAKDDMIDSQTPEALVSFFYASSQCCCW